MFHQKLLSQYSPSEICQMCKNVFYVPNKKNPRLIKLKRVSNVYNLNGNCNLHQNQTESLVRLRGWRSHKNDQQIVVQTSVWTWWICKPPLAIK